MRAHIIEAKSRLTRTDCPHQSEFVIHTHDYYEILYFVHGDADFSVEGNLYHLKRGDILLTRRNESHYLVLRSQDYYERMIIHFDLSDSHHIENGLDTVIASMLFEQTHGKFNHFDASLFPHNHWAFYTQQIRKYQDESQQIVYLLALLNELSENYQMVKSLPDTTTPNLAVNIISYIHENLCSNLSMEQLCTHFFISKSQLNRIFKKNTGTTVWKYIILKRLCMARERIEDGEHPTAVYEQCGFSDYVSFYKAYLKNFGNMPKADYGKNLR